MKKLVVYGVGCGLGNRLLTIASGLVYAKNTNRKFEMVWHEGGTPTIRRLSHCNCKFDRMFDNDYFMKDIHDYRFYMKEDEVDHAEFSTGNFWKRRFRGKNIEYTGTEHDVEFFNVGCIMNVNPPSHECKEIGFDMNSPDEHILTYVSELRDALNELKVQSEILDRVKPLSRDNTVGVHIRRTDFVDNTFSNRPQIGLEVYDGIIQREITAGNLVYLCSDDSEVKKVFNEKYGDGIFMYDFGYGEEFHSVRTERGVQDALIEILTLKNTKKIFHTNTSSFSYLPALWGDVELIGALEFVGGG